MNTKRISVTIPEDLLKESEKLPKERMEDRSTIIRQLIAKGLKQEKRKKAIEIYLDGKLSLEEAAEEANISIWKILDLLKERKASIRYRGRDAEKEIKRNKKLR